MKANSLPYDKQAVRERYARRGLKLERLAAQNHIRYPDPDTVRHIQTSIGLHGEDADGQWGPTTVAFLAAAQNDMGWDADGLLTTDFYQLFPTDQDSIPDAPHAPPLFTKSRASGDQGYYDLAYAPGTGRSWPRCDPQWERATLTPSGHPSWLGGVLRLLTGRAVNSRGVITYDRSPDDFITLDTYSLGVAHWWSGTAPKQLLLPMVTRLPDAAAHAWGEACVALLREPAEVERVTGTRTGHTRYNPRSLSWLAAGWWEIARKPHALALQMELWAAHYIRAALDLIARLDLPVRQITGGDRGVALAAIARMCNSGPAIAERAIKRTFRGGSGKALIDALRVAYHTERSAGGYSKDGNGPGRWRQLEATCSVAPCDAIMSRAWADAVRAECAPHVPDPRRSFAPT